MTNNTPFINRNSLAGLAATLVGVGIGRFAYIALMPALIQHGWFNQDQAAYLGVSTLVGYLLGAPLASFLLRFLSPGHLVRTAMVISTFSYFACAFEQAPLIWFYLWRTLAGTMGALLMILAPPMVLRSVSPQSKSRISSVVFSGLGIGAMLSGTLIPLLISTSVISTWIGMGVITLLATLLTWRAWESTSPSSSASYIKAPFSQLSVSQRHCVMLIFIAYTFDAIGYLPHTLFWVDYIVRDIGMSFSAGGFFWAAFGVGAAIGPILIGIVAEKQGIKLTLCIAFLFKAIGVGLPLMSIHPSALFISSILVGMFTPVTVMLVSTYTLECVGYELHTKAWGLMTISFALSQGIVGFLMAYLLSQGATYSQLFLVSTAALIMAALCVSFSSTQTQVASPSPASNRN
ncbi:YbfB/YjiJ family MFS transporter [Vibrio sp. Isolate30]|uniref:YbfB/YjiJ family MFS transporter n=1 Tax=Vibrio sp. Isolate30 TaxID=2908536 RepID=UPI001EFC2F21|nr:YbfB/YjiJ family MFS transporter [Vibrio sp. Isolate30]MCG9633281.1 MFS transporter [Vibrio sp. Isolate30]